MSLSLGFLLEADAHEAEEALEKLALKTEAITAGLEGNFVNAQAGITRSLLSLAPSFGLVAGGVAAVGGALFEMANRASEAGEKLYLASKATGVSVEMLQGLKLGATEVGVSFEQVQRGMAHLSLAMSDLEAPSSEAGKALAKLGINTKDANGNLLSMDELLPKIFDAFERMPEGPEKSAIALELFSRAGFQMLPLLDKGAKGLEELTAAAVKNSGITTEVAKKDEDFQESLKLLKDQLGGVAQQLMQQTIPAFTWLGTILLHQINAWKQLWEVIQIGMDKVDIWGYKLHGMSGAVQKFTKDLEDHRKALQELVATENDDGKTVGANAKLQEALKNELDGVTTSTNKHATATRDDAAAMLQAEMAAHGYVKQLELMKQVMEQSEEVERRRLDQIHQEIQNSQKQLPTQEPGGAIQLPSAMATLNDKLPSVTLKTSATTQAIEGLSQALGNMSGNFGKTGPMMQRFSTDLQKIMDAQKQGKSIADAFGAAQQKQGQNSKAAAVSSIAAIGMEAASFIKNKRAQAIVMAVMETAQGLADLAVKDKTGAVLSFASAAMYGVVAGMSGGSGASHSGGGTGGGASQPGAGGQTVTGGGGLLSSGSGGGNYHQTVVNMYGGNITDTNNLQQLAAAFNLGSSTGTVRMNVSGTSATIPTPAY